MYVRNQLLRKRQRQLRQRGGWGWGWGWSWGWGWGWGLAPDHSCSARHDFHLFIGKITQCFLLFSQDFRSLGVEGFAAINHVWSAPHSRLQRRPVIR